MVRLTTWNVNGIAPCSRKAGGLDKLLRDVGGDIVCLQEIKVRHGELQREFALADGWMSFFSLRQAPGARCAALAPWGAPLLHPPDAQGLKRGAA